MVDLEKPQHFTKEQSEWIKQYVIVKLQELKKQHKEMCKACIHKVDKSDSDSLLIEALSDWYKKIKGRQNGT